jgi:uncharacterized protein (DUF924 family)
MYVGGLVLQYPIGWASDRMDRRTLIMGLSAAAGRGDAGRRPAAVALPALVGIAMILGGITNPVYALLIAYTNDFLPRDQMAGASAGLIFLNGFGAIFGPTATGWMMEQVGPSGFFLFIASSTPPLAAYALYRMTRRAAPSVSGAFRSVTPTASPLAVEAVLEEAAKDEPSPPGRRLTSTGCAPPDPCKALPNKRRPRCLTRSRCWTSGSDRDRPKGWFNGGDAVDAACRDRFLDLWQAAHDGGLEHWVEGPAGTLAYLVLTDQFPRNMFRGEARAFATDARARAAARRAVALGWDIAVPEPERTFFYLPFEHSEDLSDQEWSVEFTPPAWSRMPISFCTPGAPRDHRPLRPLPLPQRGAGARDDARGTGIPGRRRLSGAGEQAEGRAGGEPCARCIGPRQAQRCLGFSDSLMANYFFWRRERWLPKAST